VKFGKLKISLNAMYLTLPSNNTKKSRDRKFMRNCAESTRQIHRSKDCSKK